MPEAKLAEPLRILSVRVFGIELDEGRAEIVGQALADILVEIERLRSLNLTGVDPVVVFDPVKAARWKGRS